MADEPLKQLHTHHPRRWRDFDYVYPVLSRRSGGLSLGINLNVDKVCNWDCVYCQVDRTVAPSRRDVDLGQLDEELRWAVEWADSGRCWSQPPFDQTPPEFRRLNDIAFSGDGEPTTFGDFETACRLAVEARAASPQTRIVVLSNMTMAHRDSVRRGFELLDPDLDQIWAKLETGTEAAYKAIDRSAVPFDRVLENLLQVGRIRPLVIQSLFMKLHGRGPEPAEIDAYLKRLAGLLEGGCRISHVQLYTVARQTAEPFVGPLSRGELEALRSRAAKELSDLSFEVYPGPEE